MSDQHALPPAAELMRALNDVRKSEVYGEPTVTIDRSAEDVAMAIEEFVEAVQTLIRGAT